MSINFQEFFLPLRLESILFAWSVFVSRVLCVNMCGKTEGISKSWKERHYTIKLDTHFTQKIHNIDTLNAIQYADNFQHEEVLEGKTQSHELFTTLHGRNVIDLYKKITEDKIHWI